MPGAPLPLCARCIKKAFVFASECLPREVGHLDIINDERCPFCGRGVLLFRNVATGRVFCPAEAGGCGEDLPRLREERDRLHAQKRLATEKRRAGERRVELLKRVQKIRDEGATGFVYYVQLGKEIKIGYSIDPVKRVSHLSLTVDHIVATEPGTLELEALRHEQFSELRLHGEWFDARGPLLAHIKRLQSRAA